MILSFDLRISFSSKICFGDISETFHKKVDNEYNEDIITEYESMKKKKNKNNKELQKLKEECKMWVFDTDGVNILNVLNSKYVDCERTYSNDIHEMCNTFGIEAARELLIEQMNDLFEEYINIRHIELLCDIMTNKGILTPINRQGINIGDTGPLGKCSFEDTTDQLIKAGLYGEVDHLQGVSSNIMLGQLINAGTGMCDILLDEEKLISEMQNINQTVEDFVEVSDNNIDSLIEGDESDDYCNDDNFKFSFE